MEALTQLYADKSPILERDRKSYTEVLASLPGLSFSASGLLMRPERDLRSCGRNDPQLVRSFP
jgi:hypothetical protein